VLELYERILSEQQKAGAVTDDRRSFTSNR